MAKEMSIPAYYRDKEGREKATAYLENIIRQIMDAVVAGESGHNVNALFGELFSIKFKPRFLDDTRFVVVSRYHVVITAMQIWQYKYGANKTHDLIHTATLSKIDHFIRETYLPYCEHLLGSVFHKHSNHGALAMMGKCIALKYLKHHGLHKSNYHHRLVLAGREFEKRVGKAVLSKDRWCGKRNELWVENLRTKSGLYYTYLHLAALTRTKLTLEAESIAISYKANNELLDAVRQYQNYFFSPESWPYRKMMMWPLSILQKIIFPSSKTFKAPRYEGKEGAFMDSAANHIWPNNLMPFQPQVNFRELGPIPYSSRMWDGAHSLFRFL
jgi:hypothetical protein